MPQSPLINSDFTFQKEEFSEHLNLEKYLVKVQARADKISDKFVIIFFIIGVLLAPIYQTWFFSLITGGSALLIYLLARFVLNNKFQARMLISAVYAVFMLQFIGQMHGMAETHFFFFVNAALLIIYQDWRIMLPYAILTVGHHSILAILQVAYGMDNLAYYFISYSGITITGEMVAYVTVFQLVFHFTIVSIMAVICGWWAVIFRQNSIFLMKNQIEIQVKNEQLITSDEELRQNIEELEAIQNKLNSVNNEMTYSMMNLENKNRVIEEKNLHITASINYAKRIQEAMLPKINRIEASLPNSFVFFKPKDIVSGDFYYYHEIDKALNQTELSSRSTSDGMDAAICLIDFEANQLEYVGAKNPLVYVQNSEMHVIKGDRASVGGNLIKKQKKKFTNHIISFDVPTSFYIYSDGFQDQFGGEMKIKFNIERFKQALLDISDHPFSEQEEALETIFKNWKGTNFQIDDVLVIGFELTPS